MEDTRLMRFPCVIASFIHSAAARFVCFTFYDYYCCSRRSCCCCRSCICSCCCCCALRSLNLCLMFEKSSKKKTKKTSRWTLSLFAAALAAPAPCSCATHSLSRSHSLSLCHTAFSNCQRQALKHKERTTPQPLQVDRGEKKVNLISSVCNNCPSPSLRLSFSAVSQRHVNKPSPANPRSRTLSGVAGAAGLVDVVEYCL